MALSVLIAHASTRMLVLYAADARASKTPSVATGLIKLRTSRCLDLIILGRLVNSMHPLVTHFLNRRPLTPTATAPPAPPLPDLLRQVLDFAHAVNGADSLSGYDPHGAWPVLAGPIHQSTFRLRYSFSWDELK